MDLYSDFYHLVEQDGESKRYYASLPVELKQAIRSHPENIRTFDSLHNSAESFFNSKKQGG